MCKVKFTVDIQNTSKHCGLWLTLNSLYCVGSLQKVFPQLLPMREKGTAEESNAVTDLAL